MHEIVLPKFDKEYTEACVIEGEDLLTVRPEERGGTHNLFVNKDNLTTRKCGPQLVEEGSVVLCQSFFQSIGEEEWTDMHENVKEVCRNIGVKKAEHRIAVMGMLAWRKSEKRDVRAPLKKKVLAPRGTVGYLERLIFTEQ